MAAPPQPAGAAHQAMGAATDAISFADHGVSAGFGVARMATNFGFGLATQGIFNTIQAIETRTGPNVVSRGLQNAGAAVDIAHRATTLSQDVAQTVTQTVLRSTKSGLRAAGAPPSGTLLRWTVGGDAAEAVLTVGRLSGKFFGGAALDIPPHRMLQACNAWGLLQKANKERQAARSASSARDCAAEQTLLPNNTERWIRFGAATFGHVWLAGLLDGVSIAGASRASRVMQAGGSAGDAALACAGIEGRVDVIRFEDKPTQFYAPGFLVAADYETGTVVVALRGTSSVADVLSDLVCEPEEVAIGGHLGRAHGGMLRAARSLKDVLATAVEEGLAKLPDGQGRVVITGHSLGAGVAALVAALWRDSARFGKIKVECIAFACPQVLDTELALAQSNHTTTVVVGDDLVPRLSFATAEELRNVLLLLTKSASDASAPRTTDTPPSAEEILEWARTEDTDKMLAGYDAIRSATRVSAGKLYPAGRVIHIADGGRVTDMDRDELGELLISLDMASAHMPRRYLLATTQLGDGGSR